MDLVPSDKTIQDCTNVERLEETKIKAKCVLANLIMYCKDSEHFPLILSLIDVEDPRLGPYCDLFFSLCRKFNTINRVYKLDYFPMGGEQTTYRLYDETHYWLNCCIGKAEYLFNALDGQSLNQYHLLQQLTRIVIRANGKLEKCFKGNIWNLKWPI